MSEKALERLGLDPRILPILQKWGITELYPPQAEALPLVLQGRNLVVAVPTASGKSLVAYMGLVQGALQGRSGLYVVPLRALASEKYHELRQFSHLGVKVGMSIGDLDEMEEGLEAYDILVTTSEKADSILRHRLEWGRSLSMVVADELHLMHEDDRGPTLEMLLAMLRRLNPGLQVLGLSATIRNAVELSGWLGAELVQSEWRPVELREGVYSEGRITFSDWTEREVPGHEDRVYALAKQIIDEGGQCLVFVGTRKAAESTARKLAGLLELKGISADVDEEEEVGLHKRLKWCLARGAAFHHAGLDSRYRSIVEKGFRNGNIKCLSATPTLAAGINLPARRVVVRDLKRYDPLTGSRYLPVLFVKQACGRAGRPHLDPYGEAILMARSDAEAEHLLDLYIRGESEDIESKLGVETVLRRHVLGLVASGACSSRSEVKDFMSTTFHAYQQGPEIILPELERTLGFLVHNGFVKEEEVLRATRLGKLTSDLYVDPLTSLNFKHALESGRSATPLGILHAMATSPDMIQLYITAREESSLEEYAVEHEDEFLLPLPEDSVEMAFFLREMKTARLLLDWANEVDEDEMGKRYGVGPGDIHNRVETARWLLHAMEALAGLLGSPCAGDIRHLQKRVQYGVREELLSLVMLSGVGRRRARTLYAAGYHDSGDVKNADAKHISGLPGFGPVLAEKLTGKRGGAGKGQERTKGEDVVEQRPRERERDGKKRGQQDLSSFG